MRTIAIFFMIYLLFDIRNIVIGYCMLYKSVEKTRMYILSLILAIITTIALIEPFVLFALNKDTSSIVIMLVGLFIHVYFAEIPPAAVFIENYDLLVLYRKMNSEKYKHKRFMKKLQQNTLNMKADINKLIDENADSKQIQRAIKSYNISNRLLEEENLWFKDFAALKERCKKELYY